MAEDAEAAKRPIAPLLLTMLSLLDVLRQLSEELKSGSVGSLWSSCNCLISADWVREREPECQGVSVAVAVEEVLPIGLCFLSEKRAYRRNFKARMNVLFVNLLAQGRSSCVREGLMGAAEGTSIGWFGDV